MDALRLSLERLAESAEVELVDEERYALTQLVRLAPDEQRYLDRLNLLGGLQEESGGRFLDDVRARRVTCRSLRRLQLSKMRIRPSHSHRLRLMSLKRMLPQVRRSQIPPRRLRISTKMNPPFATAATDFQEVDFSIVSTPDTPVVVDEAAPADEGRQENVMRQELESVDFYIAQGYADIASTTRSRCSNGNLGRIRRSSRGVKSLRSEISRLKRQPCLSLVVLRKRRRQRRSRKITSTDSAYASLVGDGGGGNNVGAAKPVVPE